MKFGSSQSSQFKKNPQHEDKFECRDHFNCRLKAQQYYLHYNNSVYMGGIISYKRNGQGIVLMDDGTCAITQYCYDTLMGHNVVFGNNSITSILYGKKNQYEMVIRKGKSIFKLPFYEDGQGKPSGNGLLIDYNNQKIYHLIYRSGQVIRKIVETDKKIINQVFKENSLKNLLDTRHEQSFKFDLILQNGIKILKEQRRIVIGFIDNKFNLQGLCMKINISQDYDDLRIPLDLKCFQRGFYHKNRLQNYGQRYFSNGNLYIGEFNDDVFQGRGILMYPSQMKWVYGEFEDSSLDKMISMNTGKQLSESSNQLKKNLKEIHEYNANKWMNVDLEMFSIEYIIIHLKQAEEINVTDVVIEKEKKKQEEKERLNKIMNFFTGQEGKSSNIDKTLVQQLEKSQEKHQKISFCDNRGTKIKILTVEEKNQDNVGYWSSQIYSKTPKNVNSSEYSTNAKTPKRAYKKTFFEKNNGTPKCRGKNEFFSKTSSSKYDEANLYE